MASFTIWRKSYLRSCWTFLFAVSYCGLLPCIVSTVGVSVAVDKAENNGCSAVKLAWGSKGHGSQMVPSSPISGDQLQICSRVGSTCCTRQMETKMTLLARQSFNKTVSDKIGLVREMFLTKTALYNTFCIDLIDRSSRDLHDMFTRTYGNMYEQNADIFSELFGELKSYFRGGNVDLSEMMDSFFSRLMLQMFTLLNSQYIFTDQYRSCIDNHLGNLSPLGDVPQQLSVQVKRSFIAARTFYQGLIVGRETVMAVMSMEPSQSCINAMTRMLHCPVCHGQTTTTSELKPCNGFCLNVMRGCFAQLYELNDAWNTYLDAMMKIVGRLQGPFNVESVVGPIGIKISDAIMNFQESSETVTQKLFEVCGRPQLISQRSKRRAAAGGGARQGGRQRANPHDSKSSRDEGLDALINDIRERLLPTRDFWKTVSEATCNNMAARPVDAANCWNGFGKSRYMTNVVDGKLSSQINNSEVAVDVNRKSSVIRQYALQLQIMSEKLTSAFNGRDVEFDSAEGDYISEGSGSGDESGSGRPDEELFLPYIPTGNPPPPRTSLPREPHRDFPVPDSGISFTRPTRAPVEVVTRHSPPSQTTPLYRKHPPTRPPMLSSSARVSALYGFFYVLQPLVILTRVLLRLVIWQ